LELPAAFLCPPPPLPSQPKRLSSKAALFKPKSLAAQEVNKSAEHFKKHIAEVIRMAASSVRASKDVAQLDLSEDDNGWSWIIKPRVGIVDTEALLEVAKEALLSGCSKSKSTYVMGYCGGRPFNMRPGGFEATLGAMRSAGTACWHVFKKGFCRHESACTKQHPAIQVPVCVVVDTAQLNGCQRFATAFKEVVANMAGSVAEELKKSPYIETASSSADADRRGWTVELMPRGDAATNKEYVLTLAKNALFSKTSESNIAYIMGYATKPFMYKTNGFTTIIGDMQDESKVCWDIYSKGLCTRGCACRWEHPECLIPINIVVKERPMAISLAAAVSAPASRC